MMESLFGLLKGKKMYFHLALVWNILRTEQWYLMTNILLQQIFSYAV